MTDQPTQPGPLPLPLSPSSPEAARAISQLQGHSTSALWLPQGLWPELDEIRAEHLRVREQVAAEQTALKAIDARFREEDRQHHLRLRQAHRQGRPGSVEDRRTPSEERRAERAQIEERLEAGIMVFAEVTTAVITLVRGREGDWLADLRRRLEPAQEKRREAERLLAEAKMEEWQLHQLGQWVQRTAEDGPLGRQPAPVSSAPPAQFSEEKLRSSLEVPWHRDRPWKAKPQAAA
jgi:hypothetical protein